MFEKTYAEVVMNHLRTLRMKLFAPGNVQVPTHVAQTSIDKLREDFTKAQNEHLVVMEVLIKDIGDLNTKIHSIKALGDTSFDIYHMERAEFEKIVTVRNTELFRLHQELIALKNKITKDLKKL